jgi:hypothetical protein
VSPPRLHAPRLASHIIARLSAGWVASRGGSEGLAASERGVAMVEYVTLLCLVTLIGAATVVALGVPLMQLFRYVQMVLAMPIP